MFSRLSGLLATALCGLALATPPGPPGPLGPMGGVSIEFSLLPKRRYEVPYQGLNYAYAGGLWYLQSGSRWVAVTPPLGIRIGVLPASFNTILAGGVTYYVANGIYYRLDDDAFTVVPPPLSTPLNSTPEAPLQIYAKKAQGEKQQADDRYECHRWGVKQSNFDPTLPLGGVSEQQALGKRADYQRALRSCLEGRGYAVN